MRMRKKTTDAEPIIDITAESCVAPVMATEESAPPRPTPIFENSHVMKKKDFAKYLKNVTFKKHREVSGKVGVVTALALIAAGYLQAPHQIILSLGFVLLGCLCIYNLYIFMLNSSYKSTLKANNKKLPQTTYQFSDKIYLHEGAIDMDFDYEVITAVQELDNLYLLMMGEQSAIVIKKDAFTIGTFEDFKEFLPKKCPNLNN